MILEHRFASKDPTGCILWKGAKSFRGYAVITIAGKAQRAHRVAYTQYKGEIGKGLYVCHSCDIPSCINPEHLFLGTAKDNALDCVSKGRNSKKKRDYCPKGHPYFGDNLYLSPKGHKICRECKLANNKKYMTAEYRRKENAR